MSKPYAAAETGSAFRIADLETVNALNDAMAATGCDLIVGRFR